jgi:lysozyme family protein
MSAVNQPVSDRYPAAFIRAIAATLEHEGGYSDNPADPGGETKYGISRREYPHLDIKSLSREQAMEIYYRDWWTRFHFARLPDAPAAKLFDLAVNMGPANAVRCLQRALRACGRRLGDDGALGPETIAAADASDQSALLAALRSEAAGYYRALAISERRGGEFLAGWLNRAYA